MKKFTLPLLLISQSCCWKRIAYYRPEKIENRFLHQLSRASDVFHCSAFTFLALASGYVNSLSLLLSSRYVVCGIAGQLTLPLMVSMSLVLYTEVKNAESGTKSVFIVDFLQCLLGVFTLVYIKNSLLRLLVTSFLLLVNLCAKRKFFFVNDTSFVEFLSYIFLSSIFILPSLSLLYNFGAYPIIRTKALWVAVGLLIGAVSFWIMSHMVLPLRIVEADFGDAPISFNFMAKLPQEKQAEFQAELEAVTKLGLLISPTKPLPPLSLAKVLELMSTEESTAVSEGMTEPNSIEDIVRIAFNEESTDKMQHALEQVVTKKLREKFDLEKKSKLALLIAREIMLEDLEDERIEKLEKFLTEEDAAALTSLRSGLGVRFLAQIFAERNAGIQGVIADNGPNIEDTVKKLMDEYIKGLPDGDTIVVDYLLPDGDTTVVDYLKAYRERLQKEFWRGDEFNKGFLESFYKLPIEFREGLDMILPNDKARLASLKTCIDTFRENFGGIGGRAVFTVPVRCFKDFTSSDPSVSAGDTLLPSQEQKAEVGRKLLLNVAQVKPALEQCFRIYKEYLNKKSPKEGRRIICSPNADIVKVLSEAIPIKSGQPACSQIVPALDCTECYLKDLKKKIERNKTDDLDVWPVFHELDPKWMESIPEVIECIRLSIGACNSAQYAAVRERETSLKKKLDTPLTLNAEPIPVASPAATGSSSSS